MIQAQATARYVRTSAQKAGLVLALIRGKDVNQATKRDWYIAAVLTLRDRIVHRWLRSQRDVRKNGAKQVAYMGHPLYYYVADTKPGAVTGQGSNQFGAKWWLVAPSGSAITSCS